MSIENLPTELIILITSLLPCESSLAALALANRRLCAICNPCLYQYNVLHGNSSALNWAAENDRIDTLQKALDAGAPLLTEQPSGKDRSILFGPHPISLAARGHTNIVKFMIDRGVSSNITAPGCLTPLGLAASAGHASLVKYLLRAGARQGIENALGHRPVYLAAFEGYKDVVEVLLSDTKGHGDKPNKAELMTEALFAAARAGYVSLIQLLLTHGA